ncbi:MAG: inositol monophosphatase family protein [Shinella sp.]|nr:inositol monophosphatase family protein [Shinella sp.]
MIRGETIQAEKTTTRERVELRDIAVNAALRAAELIRFRRGEGVDVAYSKSTPTDIVTAVDREAEGLIRSLMASVRPNDGFIGEEFDPSPSRSGISWVVDPIDGTVNFLYGLAPYAVSIAAITGDPDDHWEPLAGAVVNVTDQRVFSAAAGHGAYCDGRRLAVGKTSDLAASLLATGFSYAASDRAKQTRVIGRLIEDVRDIRRIGCASLEICAVAAGAIDAYFDRGLKPWDYSAATLIAREAGATVRGWSSEQPNEALTVAGNAHLVETLQPKIQKWMEEEGLEPSPC